MLRTGWSATAALMRQPPLWFPCCRRSSLRQRRMCPSVACARTSQSSLKILIFTNILQTSTSGPNSTTIYLRSDLFFECILLTGDILGQYIPARLSRSVELVSHEVSVARGKCFTSLSCFRVLPSNVHLKGVRMRPRSATT